MHLTETYIYQIYVYQSHLHLKITNMYSISPRTRQRSYKHPRWIVRPNVCTCTGERIALHNAFR